MKTLKFITLTLIVSFLPLAVYSAQTHHFNKENTDSAAISADFYTIELADRFYFDTFYNEFQPKRSKSNNGSNRTDQICTVIFTLHAG